MDKDGSGSINGKDVGQMINCSATPEASRAGRSDEELVAEFLNGFDGARGNNDGNITWNEWLDYYTDLSMSMVDDEYFVQMMQSVWQICEDESSTVSKNQIEALTQSLRHKLLDFSKNSQDEYVLRGVFKEFDTNCSGTLTADELTNMFARL